MGEIYHIAAGKVRRVFELRNVRDQGVPKAGHSGIAIPFLRTDILDVVKARLHGSPRLINTVESMKLNSTVERYCLHGSTKVNEAVDFKMAAYELVREGVVLICDYFIKECQHILEKRNKRKKRRWWVKPWIMRHNTLGASNTLLVE